MLLDDHKIDQSPKEKKPDKRLGILGLVVFGGLLLTQFWLGFTSETALVEGSYIWMPFLVFGISAFIVPPKRAFLLGVLTLPATFIFYETIWPSL